MTNAHAFCRLKRNGPPRREPRTGQPQAVGAAYDAHHYSPAPHLWPTSENMEGFVPKGCYNHTKSVEYLWSKVNKNGPIPPHCPEIGPCWIWTGGLTSRKGNGYGTITMHGKHLPAHRFFYEKTNGPIPGNLIACHRCDNNLCVRPSHIFPGTNKDNTQDAIKKGRLRVTGEDNSGHKIKREDVELIRKLSKSGLTTRPLGRMFGLHYSSIARIVRGETWNSK